MSSPRRERWDNRSHGPHGVMFQRGGSNGPTGHVKRGVMEKVLFRAFVLLSAICFSGARLGSSDAAGRDCGVITDDTVKKMQASCIKNQATAATLPADMKKTPDTADQFNNRVKFIQIIRDECRGFNFARNGGDYCKFSEKKDIHDVTLTALLHDPTMAIISCEFVRRLRRGRWGRLFR